MRIQLDVQVWRGPIPESRHIVQAVVCDAEGRTESETRHAGLATTFRSSAKPFQLLPLVERGHAERWGFSDEELAIMAASHTGSPYHLGLVRGILERIGLPAARLACGYHDPADAESLRHLALHPEERGPIYNNCSGKHAGMLCLALSEEWPVEGYERAEHPLQQLMRGTVGEMCGVPAAQIPIAVDGCSACVFGLPLAAMARGYARFVTAAEDGDARARALARIRRSMMAFPVATEGEGRFSTTLMQAGGGHVVAKAGAEGLQCVGLVARGLGLALKCEDGAARAVPPATLALLDHLGEFGGGLPPSLEIHRRVPVHDAAGLEVGVISAEVRTLTASPA